MVLVNFSAFVRGKCPCEDKALCEPIARPQGKEFLMFSTKPNDWKKYDWTKVTTIALFRPWDDELMCEAHKRVSVLVNSYQVAFFSPVRKLLPLESRKEIASFRALNFWCQNPLTSFAWNSCQPKHCCLKAEQNFRRYESFAVFAYFSSV